MSRMLEEIRQQPEALERTLASELRRIERFKQRVAKRRPGLIVLAARGTSDNAAQFGRYLLEVTTGIPVSLAAPAIYTLYNARVDYRDALPDRFFIDHHHAAPEGSILFSRKLAVEVLAPAWSQAR